MYVDMFLFGIFCLTGPQFDVDLILDRTSAQGQLTGDLTDLAPAAFK